MNCLPFGKRDEDIPGFQGSSPMDNDVFDRFITGSCDIGVAESFGKFCKLFPVNRCFAYCGETRLQQFHEICATGYPKGDYVVEASEERMVE